MLFLKNIFSNLVLQIFISQLFSEQTIFLNFFVWKMIFEKKFEKFLKKIQTEKFSKKNIFRKRFWKQKYFLKKVQPTLTNLSTSTCFTHLPPPIYHWNKQALSSFENKSIFRKSSTYLTKTKPTSPYFNPLHPFTT